MGVHWTGALNEEGVRPGTAASGLAAPSSLSTLSEGSEVSGFHRDATSKEPDTGGVALSSLSALAATAPIPQGHGRPFLGSGRAQLAVFAAVMLGGPLGVALYVIAEAVA